jgi:hypothetical protein
MHRSYFDQWIRHLTWVYENAEPTDKDRRHALLFALDIFREQCTDEYLEKSLIKELKRMAIEEPEEFDRIGDNPDKMRQILKVEPSEIIHTGIVQ